MVKAPFLRDRAEFDAYMQALAERDANEQRLKSEPLKPFGRVASLMDLRRRLDRERAKLGDPEEAKNEAKIRKTIAQLKKDEQKRLGEIEKAGIDTQAPEVAEYMRLAEANRTFDETWKKTFLVDTLVDQRDPDRIGDFAPPTHGAAIVPGDEPERGAAVPRRFPARARGRRRAPGRTRRAQRPASSWRTGSPTPSTRSPPGSWRTACGTTCWARA